MTLYEINQQYESAIAMYEAGIENIVDTETGEMLSIGDYIEKLEMDKEEKINNTILYLKNLQSDEAQLKEALTEMKKRADEKAKKIEKLEQYLTAMIGDTKKIETAQYCLKVRNTTRVVAPSKQEDIQKLPQGFRTCKVTYSPDKKAIKAVLLAGGVVEGCSIENCKSLSY